MKKPQIGPGVQLESAISHTCCLRREKLNLVSKHADNISSVWSDGGGRNYTAIVTLRSLPNRQ